MEALIPPAVEAAGLPAKSVPKLFEAIAAGTPAALKKVPGMTTAVMEAYSIALSESYSHSYAYVYYFAVALGGVCIVAAVCTRDFDQYLTDHVSRRIYHKAELDVDPLEVMEHHESAGEKDASATSAASATHSVDKEAA
jgi:hypothetical protein